MGLKPSHTPIAGRAFVSEGIPESFRACVTTVKVCPARTGRVNQSVWPTWLRRPHHRPVGATIRGADGEAMESETPPAAESAIVTATVWALPADMAGTESTGMVPEGEGEPLT